MAASKQNVDNLFAVFEKKLPKRGYYLHYQNGRVQLRQKTAENIIQVTNDMTLTPFFNWLTTIVQGIDFSQAPLPTSDKCPLCDGKLLIYEAANVPKWSYLCNTCEETGTLHELNEMASSRGE